MAIFERPEQRASREAHAWQARLRGEPGQRDRDKFQRWYGADPANSAAFDRISADWTEAYGQLARTNVGRARIGLPERSRQFRPRRYALAAASLALLFAIGMLVIRPGSPRTEIFATAIGEIRTVTLPDDSRVTLDTHSRLAVRFRSEERRVELQEGRARFFVRPQAGRSFVVEAGEGEIVVSGTVFDVSLAGDGATVALIEGGLEVHVSASATAETGRRRLQVGERVVLRPQGQLQEGTPASNAELSWPSGMLEFRNTPLRDAIAEANRYSSRQITISDPSIGELRVTGTFRAGDTAGLARSLAAAFVLRSDFEPRGSIVLRPPR
jgi:transmembrane sensor